MLLIGLAMSTDAFAAAVGKGAGMRRPRLPDALRVGLIFGAIEAVTPVVGWWLGRSALPWVEAFDHWIALALLVLLGGHMILAGLRTAPVQVDLPRHGFWNLAATGLATSIDALAVGVGLAMLDVNIVVMAAVIGLCTLAMVTTGVMLGRALGAMAGRRAEVLGGVILILIGLTIVYEHVLA